MIRALLATAAMLSCPSAAWADTCDIAGGIASGPYAPSIESLAQHKSAPEWFRDAKLGIYAHWGVYTVPAFGSEWYPTYMWLEQWPAQQRGEKFYQYHIANYGQPEDFGYHDFVPMFTADKFDADEWADLIVASGARFAGPVAEHSDGYAMWDSDVTPWNVGDTGPKRDITRELEIAIRSRGLKFMGSFHHDRHLQRYAGTFDPAAPRNTPKDGWDSHYPWVEGMATSSNDPELRQLYGNMPEDEWLRDHWFATVDEFNRKYSPDLLWFDAWLDRIPPDYRLCMSANFLNLAAGDDNEGEVMLVHKQKDLSTLWSVEDFEKGRLDKLSATPWLTDDTISYGSWSYTQDLELKPLSVLLHDFIDIVSKNGQLLLNISPKADGTIPDDQRALLLGMGGWLERNGEAIYETRPWRIYGEGPVKMLDSGRFTRQVIYSEKDLRFTTRGDDILYVTALGAPEGEFTVKALGTDLSLYPDAIDTIELLGVGPVEGWRRDADGLHIPVAGALPEDLANVWKITRKPPREKKVGQEDAFGDAFAQPEGDNE